MPHSRLVLEWLASLLVTLAVTWWLGVGALTARIDNQLLDFATTRAASPAANDIVIAAIDDRSLAEHGQWPWDRRKMAILVDLLSAANARLVVLDVLYVEPARDPAEDAALAQSVARSGRVALPYGFTAPINRRSGTDQLSILPALEAGAATTGQVAIEPESDGLVRRVPLHYSDGSNDWPHLQLGVLKTLGGKPFTGAGGFLPLRPVGSYATIPAGAIISAEVPASALAGKLVYVGATASGLGDVLPVSKRAGLAMPGIEIQANLIQALREHSFVVPVTQLSSMKISFAAIAILFLGFWWLRPAQGSLLALTLIVSLLLGSVLLATRQQLWFAPGSAICGLMLAFPLWGWRRLAAVSAFLSEKAASLSIAPAHSAPSGFDTVAREVNRLGFLVNTLDQRHSLLRKVIGSSPQAMCAFASDGSLILQNKQADKLFGQTEFGEQLQEMLINIRGQLNPDRSEMTLADGRAFTMSESLAVADSAGDGLTITAFADITAIRAAEADRRQMLDFLSHDMRSPQVAIIGLANSAKSPVEAAERLPIVIDHARRTLSLADTFVQISRLAEVPLDLEEVDLVALAHEALDRCWRLAKDREIAIKLVSSPETAFLRADPVVLSRIFDNLIGNALTYCPRNSGVRIIISAPKSAEWRVEISDDGPGLPPARRADPFVRFGQRASGSGSGLGLSFVAAAVRKHGGTITCQSSDDGTTFQITLPASASTTG